MTNGDGASQTEAMNRYLESAAYVFINFLANICVVQCCCVWYLPFKVYYDLDWPSLKMFC